MMPKMVVREETGIARRRALGAMIAGASGALAGTILRADEGRPGPNRRCI
ncbi:MAG: hypothetical protein IT577_12400 [Verrucomicrobiae bacterium]|nr:hypothetical protein [Verrucomicrobiae bacterium]